MNRVKRAAYLIALPIVGAAHAEPMTQSGSGPLPFAGYGYEYTATWESSAGPLTFTARTSPISGFQFTGTFASASPLTALTSFDLMATVEVRFIDLSTGLEALPASLRGRGIDISPFSYSLSGPQAGAVRFSNHSLITSAQVTNFSGEPLSTNLGGATPTFARYVTSVHFEGGSFLNPSPNPSCTSFDCMIPGRDQLQITRIGSFVVGTVPEPSSLLLWTAGLALFAGALRKGTRFNPTVGERAV